MKSEGLEELISKSAPLAGQIVHERPIWNSLASYDAIRHYCYGTSDGNPLWLDPSYGRSSRHGRGLAPPGFICSVLYPFLHGAPTEATLLSLIGSISVEWYAPIFEGDSLAAETRQGVVTASYDRAGRAIAFVPAETVYQNHQGVVVARAQGTMVRIDPRTDDRFLDRSPSSYTPTQLAAMDRALRRERRSGVRTPPRSVSMVGTSLPAMMRGPLSIGDLVCWQAGIGPSYRAGALGYFDALKSPHTTVLNPVTGWPLKYSQQHEDFRMAAQRGMPAPFDNSLMRFAWIIPMLTDWMGDDGFLRKLTIETGLPLIYGDTTWYRAVIWGENLDRRRQIRQLDVHITGVNQLGQTTTTGTAVLDLPLNAARHAERSVHTGRFVVEHEPASVYSRIVAQAVSRPEAPALVFEGATVSFAALLSTARAMQQLLQKSVTPSGRKLVALVLERSVDAVAAIVATLGLDAAFLVLDPNEPAARIRDVLRIAGPEIILAGRATADRVRKAMGGSHPPIVVWDGTLSMPQQDSEMTPLEAEVASGGYEEGELAYVMMTSGSMGNPKCVAVSEASLRNYVDILSQTFGYSAEDRVLHTATLSFSASIRQTFGALCNGATLVLASEAERRDPVLLFELMKRQSVTVWDTVPTVWQSAMEFLSTVSDGKRAQLVQNDLRSILLTGEPLKWRTPRMWRELGGRARVFNLYSQTETAGTVAAYLLPDAFGSDNDVVPAGRPLADCEIMFETDDVTGEQEICVSSPRLAAGYLGDPEATTDEFPIRPFHESGYRKTGDTGHLTVDGLLVVSGRLGLVTKIRGQQVSLAAVEVTIAARPDVSGAAVACHEWQNATHLVAYVVCRDVGTGLEEDIRQFVLDALGPAAVPTRIMFLERLPLTSSNKLDRSKLPPPADWTTEGATDDSDPVATEALNSIREIVSEIFCKTLSRSTVGPERNFFSLGGNSLMATRIVAQIRKAFAIEFSMKGFFDMPTIDGVSRAIESLLEKEFE